MISIRRIIRRRKTKIRMINKAEEDEEEKKEE